MTTPLLEFSSHEFGSFELAREQRALRVVGVLTSAGESVNSFDTQSINQSRLEASGSASTALDIQAKISTGFLISAGSEVNLEGSMLKSATLSVAGSSETFFSLGRVLQSSLAADGGAFAEFFWSEGYGFDISGSSSAIFYTTALVNAKLQVDSQGAMFVQGQSLTNTRLEVESTANVNLSPQTVATFDLLSQGNGRSSLKGQLVIGSQLLSEGISTPSLKAQAVISTDLSSAGAAHWIGQAQTLTNAVLSVIGLSQVQAVMVSVKNSVLSSNSLAVVEILPGRPVFKSLPPAYDVVIRPAEDRSATRPAENRMTRWK
jgi:hypothetical protein